MRIFIVIVALALAGCSTVGNPYRSANTANWYAKQCGMMVDELDLCRY